MTYNRDEDNVSELPPPRVMQAQVLGDELIERETDAEDREVQNMVGYYLTADF